jgi:hypothetical protein
LKTYIVERQTVDWSTAEPREAARTFAEAVYGDAEGTQYQLTLELMELWRSAFSTSFASCRHFLRQLAHENWAQVAGCAAIHHQDGYGEVSASVFGRRDAWLLFTDDDDWYAPDIVSRLQGATPDADVAIWPRSRFDGEVVTNPVAPEPLLCYTNNYAVRGSASRKGEPVLPVMQHFEADRRVKAGEWSWKPLPDSLSVTNKSPCSRNYLEKCLADPSPRAAVRQTVEHYAWAAYVVPPELQWVAPWIERSRRYFSDLLAAAPGS